MTALVALLVVCGTVLFAVGGMVFVRRRVPVEVLEKQHEVGGFVYAALSVIYGILLAFVVFVVWTGYQSASDAVANEADQLVDLLRLSHGFPAELHAEIHRGLRQYTNSVVVDEWPAMRDGRPSPKTEAEIEALWQVYVRAAAGGTAGGPLLAESLDRMARLADARRARLGKSASGIPTLLWILLLGGGLVMILFTYFFGIRNLRAQVLMTAALASQIAFVLFLVAAIDRPFDGLMQIDTGPFRRVTERLDAGMNALPAAATPR
jgi:hypothetical protein